MGDVSGVLELSIAIIVAIVLVITVYYLTEKKKKKEIKNKFRSFSESYKVSKKNLRTLPRIVIPSALEAILTFTDDDYFGLKAFANDMSLSGFSVKPDFPLKRLPINTIVKNTLVVTPINTFVVKEMKNIRIDHQVDKRLMAFHIEKIDEDQFDNLKQFITYLDEFLKKKKEEEEYS